MKASENKSRPGDPESKSPSTTTAQTGGSVEQSTAATQPHSGHDNEAGKKEHGTEKTEQER